MKHQSLQLKKMVVEPVMGFCSEKQYKQFMHDVNIIERIWVEDGIKIIKLWFSIDTAVQRERTKGRQIDPLKSWKLSPADLAAMEKFDDFTKYKNDIFKITSTEYSRWIRIDGNIKKHARLESIRYVLSQYDYPDKGFTGVDLNVDRRYVQTCGS